MKFNVDDLISQGLVKAKQYNNGLKVLKYSKKVFFDNLWHLDDRLLECRGLVVDDEGTIITYPFTKVFNYGENNTFVERDRSVQVVRKINGFMAATSIYNGEILSSTTGTLDSEYAKLASEEIVKFLDDKAEDFKYVLDGCTTIFEIVHPSDSHIIADNPGVYLIGCRENKIYSELFSENHLDIMAKNFGFLRPESKYYNRFSDIKKDLKTVTFEGFMIRDALTNDVLCKLKSPYYLAKKWLMRMSDQKVEKLFDNYHKLKQQIDEEYYPLIDYIVNTFDKSDWLAYTDMQRRNLIEEYLNG